MGALLRTRAVVLALVLTGVGCGLPRDVSGSLVRIRQTGVMRVGVVSHAPWTAVEQRLAGEFARSLGVRVHWVPGPPEVLLRALEGRELDLVLGGFVQSDARLQHLGLTRPYYRSEVLIGVPPGAPGWRAGGEVAVGEGSGLQRAVEEAGGRPRVVARPGDAPGARAGERWELEAWGYVPAGKALLEEGRVLVAPPGENGLLRALDVFLHRARVAVPGQLVAERPR